MKTVRVDGSWIREFVDLPDRLYRGDDRYVPYMKRDLRKTLKRLLLEEKSYTALLVLNDSGEPLGRVLFTIDKNKQLRTDRCGFFSLYECADDPEASRALLGEMKRLLAEAGAEYISGTYSPYDPDNRRGIMVKGFERAPLIFTSYNPPYYNDQLLDLGFEKDRDTYEYTLTRSERIDRKLKKLADYAVKTAGVHVDPLDFTKIDRDVRDFHAVMEAATNEIVYQEAPTEETLRSILKEWKSFLEPDFVLIARRDSDQAPVGILLALPDFFQVFRKMRGRTDLRGLLAMLSEKKKIRAVRGTLQYVIPEYQKKGVIGVLYYEFMKMTEKHGIDYVEAGTIMENNGPSNSAIRSIGGELSRIYRIYTMKLS